MNGTIFNRTRQYTAYVDDVLIVGQQVRVTEEVINTDQRSCSKEWIGDKQKQNKIHENTQKYNKFRVISDNEWTSILRDSEF